MAGIGRMLQRIAPEADLEGPIEGDPDALQHVDVHERGGALDPPDNVTADTRPIGQVGLCPVPALPRQPDLAADVGSLLPTSTVGLDRDRGPPCAAHEPISMCAT
jgi:hypothetical protein